VIRPITLGVRLAVNLLTGHLLLSMLRGLHVDYLIKGGFFIYLIILLIGVGGFIYEFCVCLVQALVYALMISQYLDEHSC
jgi:F0F1-type ATP synthase membrane subunit a